MFEVYLNAATVCAWVLGIAISVVAAAKSKSLRERTNITFAKYASLVAITEVLYTIGAIMILAAMGINVSHRLNDLGLWDFWGLSELRWTEVVIVGWMGWIGFILNRTISFLTPVYLLVKGGARLPKYFYYSAWTEISLEIITTMLIFACLEIG